jgi:hypothetical protein
MQPNACATCTCPFELLLCVLLHVLWRLQFM